MINFLVMASLLTIIITNAYIYIYIVNLKHRTNVATTYAFCSILLFFQSISYLGMIVFNGKINLFVFEYISQIAYLLLPPSFFIISLLYWIPNINYKKLLWVYIIPTISIIFLWTNQLHGLYFASGLSYNFSNVYLGPVYYLSSMYSYVMMLLPIILISYIAIRKKIILQKKITLYFLLTLIPVAFNILSTLQVLDVWPIFMNCIVYSFSVILIALVILEYKITNLSSYAESLALNNMIDPFMVVDKNGNIIMVNKAFLNTVGKAYNLFLFDNIKAKLVYTDIDFIKKFDELTKKVINMKKPITTRSTIIIKDKAHIFNVDISELTEDGKLTLGFLVFYKDITNHLTHLNTIKEQRDIIFSQDRLATIGKLASSFAQDINEPLKSIESGIMELKKSNLFESDDLDVFGQMESCKQRISDIASNLVSTYSTSSGEIKEIRFEVNETLLPIKHIVASELKKYDCFMHINTSEPVYLIGNPTKFSQVITNLVINAIQAYENNKGGTVYVSIVKTKTKVIINVIDNAGGISDKIKANLFKKVVTTKGGKGTGLGLRLSHSIITEEFGGNISFETDNLGTTFSVSIPINIEKNKE